MLTTTVIRTILSLSYFSPIGRQGSKARADSPNADGSTGNITYSNALNRWIQRRNRGRVSLHVQQVEGRIPQLSRATQVENTHRHMKSTRMLHGQVGEIGCRPRGAASAGQDYACTGMTKPCVKD